ncbi:MFS transporter, partial [bacterium]|nr:MFS transporter [bacterium]
MPEKRDDAFNIFYMGINLGAFASPLVAATLRNTLGWHYAFGAAGIGMIISGIIFIVFKRHYVAGDIHTDIIEDGAHVKHPVSKQQERKRLAALMLVFLVVIVFWMAFEQNGFTLNFWARDATDAANMPNVTLDRNYLQETGERRLAAELTQAINPFFVLLFTPLLVGFWNLLRRRRREPSTAAKIGIGMVITAGAYMILTSAGFIGGDFGRVHVGWLVSAYATITIAELCLSPMGLSLVSKLAPARIRGMMMGGWFAASAVGGILAGLIGGLWDHMLHSSFFLIMVVASLAAAAIFFFVIKFIRPIIAEAEQAALTSTQ